MAQQKMIGSEAFVSRIQAFLNEQAASDEAFAAKLKSDKRTVQDCAAWMLEQLAQKFRDSGQCGYDDSDIYGMALHFYDEKDLKAKGNMNFQGMIVSNAQAHYKPAELSDEEKAGLDAAAREQYKQEQVRKLREAEQKGKEKEEKRIAKAKERKQQQAQQYVQPLLFDM